MIEINYGKLRDFLINKTNKSVELFCKEIGISRPTYYRILRKKSNSVGITFSTLNKICSYFGEKATDYLIYDEEQYVI